MRTLADPEGDLFIGGDTANTIALASATPLSGASAFAFAPGVDQIEIARSLFGLSAGYAVADVLGLHRQRLVLFRSGWDRPGGRGLAVAI